MNKPTIHPICMTDSFTSKTNAGTLKAMHRYNVIGFGYHAFKGVKMQSWHLESDGIKFHIPKSTLTELYKRGLVVRN